MVTSAAVPTPARRQVALFMDSGTDFVVGLFGAWQAGLGVLPLPPAFPDERLGSMLRDCRPETLLTTPQHRDRASELISRWAPGTRLVVEQDEQYVDPVSNLRPTGPDAAAFTVYTSGSSGTPKGVLVSQANLSPLIRWFGEAFVMGPGSRIAQTLSLGFDFGLQELFTSLPFGACLVVPDPADRRDAGRYARFLRRSDVTVLYTTPSFAQELVAAGELLPSLKFVLFGGEVLTGTVTQAFRRLVSSSCRLFNGYGPTEATVNCLVHEVPPAGAGSEPSGVLPVGSATSGSWVRITDPAGRPLPVGAVGELLIGGNGVTDGYLGRPEQTTERFVPVPAEIGRAGRVYRTGDVGYLQPGGELVVLGRLDRQVKIRGFRVEPGEVEQVLTDFPGVLTAVVRPIGAPRRLVAFVVLDADASDIRQICADAQSWVGDRLPAAMVPEQMVVLEAIPLNANGKADEAALDEIAVRSYVAPVAPGSGVSGLEKAIQEVWGRVLRRTPPPPNANVFDLGAHSMAAMEAHQQLQATVGQAFPAHYLFEYPEPRLLAEQLYADRNGRGGGIAVPSSSPTKDT